MTATGSTGALTRREHRDATRRVSGRQPTSCHTGYRYRCDEQPSAHDPPAGELAEFVRNVALRSDRRPEAALPVLVELDRGFREVEPPVRHRKPRFVD